MNCEEINNIARKFLELKNKAAECERAKREYKKYQNYCFNKFNFLVNNKTYRYKKFSNYNDLKQDGFEALMLAFKTYDPDKGDFIGWASRYINTKVCRAANAHSTIKYPIKKAKNLKPYKTTEMPVLIDSKNPLTSVENFEDKKFIREAIEQLPERQKQVILSYYDFEDKSESKNVSITKVSKNLKMSRPVCVKLLAQAEVSLKEKLSEQFG